MRTTGRSVTALVTVLGIVACSAGDEPRAEASDAAADDEPEQVVLGPHDGRDLPGVDLDRIRVGDVAPDFTLDSYDDGLVTLSDFRGEKDVILVFYRGYW